jgi:hypothetical protein
MAFAMFSTAMRMKPSATASGVRPSPIRAASSSNAARTAASSIGSFRPGPNTAGKNCPVSFPVITLASVIVSGPPRR